MLPNCAIYFQLTTQQEFESETIKSLLTWYMVYSS